MATMDERINRASIEGFNTLLNLFGTTTKITHSHYGDMDVECLVKRELREEDLEGTILSRVTVTIQFLLDDYPYSSIAEFKPSGMNTFTPSNDDIIKDETMGIGTIMGVYTT